MKKLIVFEKYKKWKNEHFWFVSDDHMDDKAKSAQTKYKFQGQSPEQYDGDHQQESGAHPQLQGF